MRTVISVISAVEHVGYPLPAITNCSLYYTKKCKYKKYLYSRNIYYVYYLKNDIFIVSILFYIPPIFSIELSFVNLVFHILLFLFIQQL